eukprot:COSAG03_NODE_294_length_9277_cov_22.897799_1_plen_25_part_10
MVFAGCNACHSIVEACHLDWLAIGI